MVELLTIQDLRSYEDQLLQEPLEEITAEQYFYALEVLPPMAWRMTGGIDHFLMSEFECGNITRQYAQYNERYYSKYVNAFNKNTWITLEQITALITPSGMQPNV